MDKTNLNQNSEKQPSNPLNTEQLTTDLRPPKKPAEKAFGKYFRKVEVNYDNVLGYREGTGSIDGRYAALMMVGSLKDSDHWANSAMAMTFFGIIVFMQITALVKFGELGPYLTQPYTWVTQLLLLYAALQFKKSKKNKHKPSFATVKLAMCIFPPSVKTLSWLFPLIKWNSMSVQSAIAVAQAWQQNVLSPKCTPKPPSEIFSMMC
ncbi:hypothetical protein DXX93_15215 [Thalassotalea euphylliae]|uniref:Uncharacterized protein n=1 Tax=Thalassotalea euphylliae TaxID=1655234 RepID=A0A3E0TTM7_9GAMM|nr:hypothetical protein [Thalassotalea euphylliae]REL27774.1 hypothetical protein DXX93_15215 [Thalassotalea euphylliae]